MSRRPAHARSDAPLWPPRLDGCRNCGSRRELTTYAAQDIDRPGAPFRMLLCARCVRDRGAAWRWRWKLTGRSMPDEDRAA